MDKNGQRRRIETKIQEVLGYVIVYTIVILLSRKLSIRCIMAIIMLANDSKVS